MWQFRTGNTDLHGFIARTLYGSPQHVDGVRGKALSFDGVDQWADYGSDP